MTGDQQDILQRLKAVLPVGWFPDSTPVLDAVLMGLASAWSWVYCMLQYVVLQTRLATVGDVWLDIAAFDFFGSRVARNGQSDATFRQRILRELLRPRGTRSAVSSVLVDLTGRQPVVFEPARPSDTGAWGGQGQLSTRFAYGSSGGWGSLALPFQFFVTAYRPIGAGIANVAGWGTAAGGYGVGAIEYGDLTMMLAPVTDFDIFSAVASVIPTATVAWTSISN